MRSTSEGGGLIGQQMNVIDHKYIGKQKKVRGPASFIDRRPKHKVKFVFFEDRQSMRSVERYE
jgi:hypothetical protein